MEMLSLSKVVSAERAKSTKKAEEEESALVKFLKGLETNRTTKAKSAPKPAVVAVVDDSTSLLRRQAYIKERYTEKPVPERASPSGKVPSRVSPAANELLKKLIPAAPEFNPFEHSVSKRKQGLAAASGGVRGVLGPMARQKSFKWDDTFAKEKNFF